MILFFSDFKFYFMKHSYIDYAWKSILLIVILVILNKAAMAQVPSDTTKSKVDTTTMKPADTAKPAQAAAATTPPASNEKAKPKQFNFYIGGNSNTMSGSTASYNANSALGYQIGVAW
jgi:hypothetical protein